MSTRTLPSGAAVMDRVGIGHTPLLPLPGITRRGQVWLKAEYDNPFGSVKDRTAAFLLAWACHEADCDVHVVESTSGNLGVALARLGHRLGVPVTLVMDATLPAARVAEVRALGADVRLVDDCAPGMTFREARIAAARELGDRPGWLWLNQYANDAGMRAHIETTGPEIRQELPDGVDAVVASVGTGGTLCGIGASMRAHGPAPAVVGVEPLGSTISGGADADYLPAGAGMRGPSQLTAAHGELIDYFAKVPDCVAATWALSVRERFGVEVGQTTGGAVAVAAMLAHRYGLRVVAVAPDHGHAFRQPMRRLAACDPRETGTDRIRLGPFRVPATPVTAGRTPTQKPVAPVATRTGGGPR
jgi:cysteine synthase